MNARHGRRGLWVVAVAAWIAAGFAWLPDSGSPSANDAGSGTGPAPRSGAPTAAASDTAPFQTVRNPFRLDGRSSDRRISDTTQAPIPMAAAQGTTPATTPVLLGLIGGPPWIAFVENAPGLPGLAMIRDDEAAGGIRLLKVVGDTIKLTGPDSTLTLVLRKT